MFFAIFALGCGEKPSVDTGPGADQDADGYVSTEDGGDDCDDGDPSIHPGADEVCDGADNDCDGALDEGDALDAPTWFADGDGDGFGDPEVTAVVCDAPPRFIADASDCDDGEDLTFPGADELCDGVDNDCDGTIDEGAIDPPTWYADSDGDGYGDAAVAAVACPAPSGFVAGADDGVAFDCDDRDPEVHPGAEEPCGTGMDADCDGAPTACSATMADADLTLLGDALGDGLGLGMIPAGDVDGDGHPDLLIGAPGVLGGQGAGYLLYGPVTASGAVEVGTLAGARLLGAAGQGVGTALAGGGDLDGDGLDDLLLSSCAEASNAGVVWVVTEAPRGDVGLASAPITLSGVSADDFAGGAVWLPGDLDADGHADLAVGAWSADGAVVRGGVVYLLYGPIEPGSASLDSADAFLQGSESDAFFGQQGAPVGDVDGDGYDDLLTGEPYARGAEGAVCLFLGPVEGTTGAAAADVVLTGEDAEDTAGGVLAGAGDTDGDGYRDFLVGATGADGHTGDVGAVYLVHGPGASGSLADAPMKLLGTNAEGGFGAELAGDLDADDDGVADLLVAEWHAGADRQGAVWLFWGPLEGALSSSDAAAAWWGEDDASSTGLSLAVVPGLDGSAGANLAVTSLAPGDSGDPIHQVHLFWDWVP